MLSIIPTEGLDGFTTFSQASVFKNAAFPTPMSPRPFDSDYADLEIKGLIDSYARTLAGNSEEALFFSFAKLANCILARACPDNTTRAGFVTTDPKRILGSQQRVRHSPDVVVVLVKHASCKGFGWKHVLFTFEVELRQIRRPERRECGKSLIKAFFTRTECHANTRGPLPGLRSSEALRTDLEVLEQRSFDHRGRYIIPERLSQWSPSIRGRNISLRSFRTLRNVSLFFRIDVPACLSDY